VTARVDPALLRELASAGDDGLVQAAIALGPVESFGMTGVRSLYEDLMARVSAQTGDVPVQATLMPNLGVIVIRASGRFVRTLLAQDQVVSASATATEGPQPEGRPTQ
jgi:hypothetical protein